MYHTFENDRWGVTESPKPPLVETAMEKGDPYPWDYFMSLITEAASDSTYMPFSHRVVSQLDDADTENG
jgi:hypothetical protein